MIRLKPLPILRSVLRRTYAYTLHTLLPALWSTVIGILLTAWLHHAGFGWLF